MRKSILVVDDDQEILLTLKEGLERYHGAFLVSIAGDGLIAVEKLRREPISLVVADLKMPRMNGFELLSHITRNYPDIPVVAITGYGSAAAKEMARKNGAAAYLAKPFAVENLARLIMEILGRHSEGGSLNSVSSGTFLQLMELEQKTCTVRMVDRKSGKMGVLFFRNGELLDARCEGLQGLQAAYRIFAWDEVALSIQNECPRKTCVINSDLQPIILEAMRLKDEAHSGDNPAGEPPILEEIDLIEVEEAAGEAGTDPLGHIRRVIASELGETAVTRIREDPSYRPILEASRNIGKFFSLGEFAAGYIERGQPPDVVLAAGDKPIVLEAAPRCPRDRLMRALGRMKA